ncbi:RDD family protein [Streptomyces sp. NPDC005202]|uniref:RDD family protein n=1 Tax=Streptomyces sp. NPDC005202 TaxID=3157021 RepID=UPI0033A419FB
MSAPTPAPGDDRPREGYYPDPSIPGYVRYWNGAAWVPGTSRPAPTDGKPLSPPPGVRPAPAAAPAVEETGPHFFDEEPVDEPGPAGAQHGGRPEPASAWGADPSRQSGFGGDQDRRVSWGAPTGADPRLPHTADPAGAPAPPDGRAARTDGTATIPPASPDAGTPSSDGTFVFRRPTAETGGAGSVTGGAPSPGIPGPGGPADEGTMTFRAVQRTGPGDSGADGFGGQGASRAAGFGAPGPAGAAPSAGGPGSAGAPASGKGASGPGFAAGKAAAARAAAAQAQAHTGAASAQASAAAAPAANPSVPSVPSAPSAVPVPQQSGTPLAAAAPATPAASDPVATPVTTGPGGGQSSWAQQVHRLAGAADDQPVAPWKPPVEDPFQAAVRRQAAARPAGVGKRLAARLVDTVVLAGVTAAAAVPLGTKAVDHINDKIDAAKLSGRPVTVWLLDGTTATYLGIVLAVLLLSGVVYEVLPTAKWGRTLGKKLCGLQVRDIEAHEPPSFGAALRRWLVYSVPGLLGIGLVGVVWCLFDRPWHQCWHDKAAHTFVAG